MGLESCEHGVVLVSSGVTACMSCFMLPWQGQDLVWFARAPSRGRRSAFYALKLLRKGGQKCKLGGSACVEFAIYVAFVGLWGSKRSGISVCVAGAVLAIFIWHVTSRCCNDRAGRGLVTQPYTRNLTQPYTPLSWICVRGWVGSVCVAEFWPCAPLSWICVRRWVVYPGGVILLGCRNIRLRLECFTGVSQMAPECLNKEPCTTLPEDYLARVPRKSLPNAVSKEGCRSFRRVPP